MRLPPFLTEEPRLRAVLCAADAGTALLQEDADRRNEALSYRTSDEGLRRWERELGLGSDGSAAARRARVYAALTGGTTLTVEELKRLALTLTDAQTAEVKEFFARRQVVLSALFEGEAGDLTALREAVARRKPAHLNVKVQSTLPAGELVYHGTATPLSVARSRGRGVSAGGAALYGGGQNGETVYNTVDAYDAQLVRTALQPLFSAACNNGGAMAAATAVFAGGSSNSSGYTEAAATAYNADLTRSAAAGLSVGWAQYGSAVGSGLYAVFGGGYTAYASVSAKVSAVSGELVASYPAAFSKGRGYYGAARAGDSVLFAGGGGSGYLDTVDAYGPELEKLAAAPLPVGVLCPGSAEAGDCAVFCGGRSGESSYTAVACAYSPELTRTALTALSAARHLMHSVSLQGSALFAGGCTANRWFAAADGYDEELVHTVLTDLSVPREEYNNANGRGAAVGNFALICGGKDGSAYYSTVDVFTVE